MFCLSCGEFLAPLSPPQKTETKPEPKVSFKSGSDPFVLAHFSVAARESPLSPKASSRTVGKYCATCQVDRTPEQAFCQVCGEILQWKV